MLLGMVVVGLDCGWVELSLSCGRFRIGMRLGWGRCWVVLRFRRGCCCVVDVVVVAVGL